MEGIEPSSGVLETPVLPLNDTPLYDVLYYERSEEYSPTVYIIHMDFISRIETVLRFIPELNDKQLDRLSEFLSNLSLLIVATLILPNIFGGGKPNTNDLMSGVALTMLLLSISMIIIRKNDE